MRKQWSMVGAIILFLGVAILSVLNVEPVPVNFGFAEVEWPLIVIIFVSVLLGALIATLLSTYKMYTDQRKSKHQKADSSSKTSKIPSSKKTRSNKDEFDKDDSDKVSTESHSEKNDIL
ncbi:MAG: lipopolysaccharide assembly protein LapA domain-containing protein [Alkalibacterium sp.]|uniref:LapA family protein n=1 Tax=Alkalibacterium sp. TaxID=1872447 RepID=UPI0039707966